MKGLKMIDGTLLNQIESCINDAIVNIKQINTGYVNDFFLIRNPSIFSDAKAFKIVMPANMRA